MFEHDRELADRIAAQALQQIRSFGLPPDPINFEFWYTYCAGHHRALNNAVNQLLAANAKPSRQDLWTLYEQHLPSRRLSTAINSIGRGLQEQTDHVFGAIRKASGATDGYGEELITAFHRFHGTEDRGALASTIATLIESTEEIQKTNALLRTQLAASAEQLRGLQERLETVQAESMLDPLTGLANRRLFDLSLELMIAKAESQGDPLSLLLMDIDNFKTFNDRFGHLVGDDVLRLVSAAIRLNTRHGDLVCRFGGDEFAIILAQTPVEGALEVAEKIRISIMDRELRRRSTQEALGRLTVSIGVSQHQRGQPLKAVVERADHWLYAAKRSGRNRVAIDPLDDPDRRNDNPTARRLVWHKAYECGNSTIDRQHRELYALADALFDPSLNPESSSASVDATVDKLLARISEHFADEEAVLAEVAYDGLAAHRSAHSELLAEARELRAAIATSRSTLGDLREFIANNVVAEHMLKTDREFFPLFARDAAPAQPRQGPDPARASN